MNLQNFKLYEIKSIFAATSKEKSVYIFHRSHCSLVARSIFRMSAVLIDILQKLDCIVKLSSNNLPNCTLKKIWLVTHL